MIRVSKPKLNRNGNSMILVSNGTRWRSYFTTNRADAFLEFCAALKIKGKFLQRDFKDDTYFMEYNSHVVEV